MPIMTFTPRFVGRFRTVRSSKSHVGSPETTDTTQRAEAKHRNAYACTPADARPTRDAGIDATRRASRQRRQPLLMPRQRRQEPSCRRGLERKMMLAAGMPRRGPSTKLKAMVAEPFAAEARGPFGNSLRASGETWATMGFPWYASGRRANKGHRRQRKTTCFKAPSTAAFDAGSQSAARAMAKIDRHRAEGTRGAP